MIGGLVTIHLIGQPDQTESELTNTATLTSSDPVEDLEFDPSNEEALEDTLASCGESHPSSGEGLSAPAASDGVVEIPTATPEAAPDTGAPIDPIRRIGSLESANRTVAKVNLQDDLQIATTLMMFEGYSQLAIMQDDRNVRGVVSWESIAKRSMSTPSPTYVRDCRVDAQVIEGEGTLFEALPTIERHGYVLVRSKGRITGIVTASDLAVELRSLSYAFVSIGTIEGLIRRKLHPHVTPDDLQSLEDHSKARVENDVSSMTFGENIRLLERDEVWNKLSISIDKALFLKRLLVVRDIRNDVMHFNPDPLGTNQKRHIEQMEAFLRQVFL